MRLAFTIIITNANAVMAELHDRMPVIFEPKDWVTWSEKLTAMLQRGRDRPEMMC